MYKLNNDRDFYRVIDIKNGYWLETISQTILALVDSQYRVGMEK